MVLAFMRLESDYSDYVFKKHDVGNIIKRIQLRDLLLSLLIGRLGLNMNL